MSVAIRLERLGKSYQIRHEGDDRFTTLREMLTHSVRGLGRRILHPFARPRRHLDREVFWALRDIDLEVNEGARVGVIGSNGAGKSTLLKLLSRITEPTEGRISIQGRISSLLEVGTGFHPELTGRENIFLNGTILGMRSAEIRGRFDEIVAFADIERFLDTPVKRYSSGMYVRLAFSVAAHLEPEILIVDEVLAVGDAQFQRKCIGKMEQVNKEGRTIIFVSHNMNAVEQLCTSALLLKNGRAMRYSDDVRSVVNEYLFAGGEQHTASAWAPADASYRSESFSPTSFRLEDASGEPIRGPIDNGHSIDVVVEGRIERAQPDLQVGFAVYDAEGRLLFWSFHTDGPEASWARTVPGEWEFRTRLPRRFLNQGTYRIYLGVALYHRAWLIEPGTGGASVTVTISGGLSDSPFWMVQRPGILAPELPWIVEKHS